MLILIVPILVSACLLSSEAAPISESASTILEPPVKPLGIILFVPEFRDYQDTVHGHLTDLHRRSERMTRSVMDQDNQDPEDDLETAAGTNLLRPLFVYRQQMAYRERNRKTGRRAAPGY